MSYAQKVEGLSGLFEGLDDVAGAASGAPLEIALDAIEEDPNCLIPGFDGALFTREWKDALWARFTTAAPQRLRQSVERSSIVKTA